MSDRLRDLIDLVIESMDDGAASGPALARRAGFSREHLDRLLAAATGEPPVALRRRLLLERAGWQLATGAATPTEAAPVAGYGSLAAFSRAFSRAFGMPPAEFAAAGRKAELPAPNGIHFHPPAGLLIPGARLGGPGRGDLSERMVRHHLDRSRELIAIVETLDDERLDEVVRPGQVLVWFEGPDETVRQMAERLVFTLEVWVAAIAGDPAPPPERRGRLAERLEPASREFARLARWIRDRGAWDDAFVDALCEPPQSFTYGGVLSHVLAYGAVRREALASVLAGWGLTDLMDGDPILWESKTRSPLLRPRSGESDTD